MISNGNQQFRAGRSRQLRPVWYKYWQELINKNQKNVVKTGWDKYNIDKGGLLVSESNIKPEPISKRVAAAALYMALSENRDDELLLKQKYQEQGLQVVAVNYGGQVSSAVPKVIERAVVAAKREGVIADIHGEEGAVAGAAHEAFTQILNKALGLNIGGKIGIARYHDHITVAMVMEVGLLHLNEVAVGMAHRAV